MATHPRPMQVHRPPGKNNANHIKKDAISQGQVWVWVKRHEAAVITSAASNQSSRSTWKTSRCSLDVLWILQTPSVACCRGSGANAVSRPAAIYIPPCFCPLSVLALRPPFLVFELPFCLPRAISLPPWFRRVFSRCFRLSRRQAGMQTPVTMGIAVAPLR